ncbi:MAG: hypothetical protein ABFR05_08285, partial [Bacteroidota bacterium]
MKQFFPLVLIISLLLNAQISKAQVQYENQEIDAQIDVANSMLSVENQISLPSYLFSKDKKSIEFFLNKNLNITNVDGAKIEKLINADTLINAYVNKYKLVFKKAKDHN